VNHRHFFDHHAATWDRDMDLDALRRLSRVVRMAGVEAGERILDLGSGTGVLIPHLLDALGPRGTVVAADFSAEMIRQSARRRWDSRVSLVQADGLRLPFANGAFDRVLCNATLPHFADKQAALGEMTRVLRPGGVVVISHPIGRRRVAEIHQAAGGPVEEDRVPNVPVLTAMLYQAGARVTQAVDDPEFHFVSART